MQANLKDLYIRALKTFVQTFVSVLTVVGGLQFQQAITPQQFANLPWEMAVCTAIGAALVSVINSLTNVVIVAYDKADRAIKTFLQTFVSHLIVQTVFPTVDLEGFVALPWATAALTAAVAAMGSLLTPVNPTTAGAPAVPEDEEAEAEEEEVYGYPLGYAAEPERADGNYRY